MIKAQQEAQEKKIKKASFSDWANAINESKAEIELYDERRKCDLIIRGKYEAEIYRLTIMKLLK